MDTLLHFIYALVNVAIVAVIAVVFGRRTVTRIFSSHRGRIEEGLDRAERLETEPDPAGAQTVCENPEPDSSADDTVESELAQINAARDEELERIRAKLERDTAVMRVKMLESVRRKAIVSLHRRAAELIASEPYIRRLDEKESEIADSILSRIRVTPGDMAYLKKHGVLYVTLTSAHELAAETVERIGNRVTEMLGRIGGHPSYWVKVDESLVGGMQLRIGDTVYDCTAANEIYHLGLRIAKRQPDEKADAARLIADITQDVEVSERMIDVYQVGRVINVSDGICWLDGLSDIMYGEVVEFQCGERGMVLDIDSDRIGCVVFGKYEHIESGTRVRRAGRIASVPVGEKLLGRVLDPQGNPLDGKGRIWGAAKRPIEFPAPAIPDRKPVSVPLHTGIKAIDALVPIGRGQRELIIGDRQTGKTSIATDAIINQKGKGVICIYVAIGQKDASLAELVAKLESCGAMEYTTIVSAPASSSASVQYIAPYAGTAMGEYFMYSGRDVLIVYDDLSKHAVAYRELSLLLHRPSGREAYPGDIFYLHSRLLERSARLSEEAGGGSMTALPIIETQAGDISAYIPTNVISITDGQIFLDTDLFHEGQRPAVDVGLSVSRVGGAAQTKLMKYVSSSLRVRLAQYRELSAFAQFGSDLDESTAKVLDSGRRMTAALRQSRYAPISDERQALLLAAVSAGYADGAPVEDIENGEYEKKLFAFFEENYSPLLRTLSLGAKPDDAFKAELDAALERFAKGYVGDGEPA